MVIIVELNGGLGNQMFICAAGLALTKKTKQKLKIDPTHLTALHLKRKWAPEILKFNLSGEVATKKDIRKFILRTPISYINILFYNKRWFEKNVLFENKDINLNNFFSIQEGYLRGFFADPRYFAGLKKVLQKEFSLKEEYCKSINKLLKEISSNKSSVSIHVRRGDLLNLEGTFILPIKYYYKAVKEISKYVKNPKYYVFSDGIAWCKKNFNFLENVKFIGGNSVAEDFELMKNCKHHILANSSLSWWVGYLCDKKDTITICPSHFGFMKNDGREKLILKTWNVININEKNIEQTTKKSKYI